MEPKRLRELQKSLAASGCLRPAEAAFKTFFSLHHSAFIIPDML